MTQIIISFLALVALIWLFYARARKERSANKTAWLTEFEKPFREEKESQPKKNDPQPLDHSEINRTYRIADMHFSRGNFEEAEKWFIKVLALNESHPESLNCLGMIYIHQNSPRKAEILYRNLLSITQKESAYYCNYGRCLYNQGRLSEALEAYENAVKLDCTKPTRFISIGQIYFEQKDFIKALGCFSKALELDPQNIAYLTQTAELAEMVGDSDRMRKYFKKILELDPYNKNAKSKLADMG